MSYTFEECMSAAQKVIETYGADSIELGLTVLRIEAGASLAPGVIAGVIGVVIWKFFNPIKLLSEGRAIEKAKDKRYVDYHDTFYFIAGVLSAIALGVVSWITLYGLSNIWAWVGIFYPEAYAVHKFLL